MSVQKNSSVTGSIVQGGVQIASVPISLDTIGVNLSLNNDNSRIPLTQSSTSVLGLDLIFKLESQDSITIPAGNYYFKEIKVAGGARVKISGNVNIFCAGDVLVTGGSEFNAGESSDRRNLCGRQINDHCQRQSVGERYKQIDRTCLRPVL